MFSVGSTKSYAPKQSAPWSVIDTVGFLVGSYDREFVNTGDFDRNSGKFTAPSPGFYFFTFNGRKPHGMQFIFYEHIINNLFRNTINTRTSLKLRAGRDAKASLPFS